MRIIIRAYDKQDRPACLALCRELAEHHADIYEVPRAQLKDQGNWLDGLMRKEGFAGFWVAEADGNTAGFYGLFVNGDEGEIEPVVITGSLRNKGIGERLLEHAAAEAKKRGVRFLGIRPVARNQRAMALFVRAGFGLVGQVELFKDQTLKNDRTWKTGLLMHGQHLGY